MKTKNTNNKGAKGQYASLHDLFILKLNSLLFVENELIKALPKMAQAARNGDLRVAFTEHLKETRGHAARLEQILEMMGEKQKRIEVAAIQGLIEDGEWCIKNIKTDEALDVALIAAAQYVENYERAGYGTARAWAETMGHDEAASLLGQTLEEEEASNNKLTELAEGGINQAANEEEEMYAESRMTKTR